MTVMERNGPSDSLEAVERPDWQRRSRAIRERRRRTGSTPLTPSERRDHTRHTAHVIMEIRGRVQGSRVTEIRGVTADLSRGGALAVFTDHVAVNPDNPFMVRFVDAGGMLIAPECRWGTILRSDPLRSEYVVAVKFQQLLPPALLVKFLGAHLAPRERLLLLRSLTAVKRAYA